MSWTTPSNRDPQPRPQHGFDDATRGPRLQKVLAEAGIGSRRACETLIEAGHVTVNGHTVSRLPAWIDPVHDRVAVDGRSLRRPQHHVYVLLNKPRGVVCTNEEREGRRAIDLVAHPSRVRLYPVGRLDRDSSGLLLLTNDGELANRLTHPRFGVHKVYEVTVAGLLDEEAVRKLEGGIFLSDRHATRGRRPGRKTTRSRLQLIRRGRDRTKLRMELREGRNRQVRRMLLYVGHKVKRLRRVQMGPLRLTGVRVGQWRDLTPREVTALRRAAGVEEDAKPRRTGGRKGASGGRRPRD